MASPTLLTATAPTHPPTPVVTPAPPSVLLRSPVADETTVAFGWETPAELVGEAEGYEVFSDMGTGFGIFIRKARVVGSSYTDVGLQPGRAYRYIVRAARHGESASRQVRADTLARPEIAAAPPVISSSGVTRPAGTVVAHATVSVFETPTQTPTPVPADTILLGLMSSNDFTDELGNIVIVGEVRNDASVNAAAAEVSATFYNRRGAVIQQPRTKPLLSILKPAQRSPFLISLARPPDLWEWSLRAIARPTQDKPQEGLTVVKSRAFEDKVGFYHVTGTVLNGGSLTSRLAQVVVTLYDKWGKIVNTNFAYTNPSTIAEGFEAGFDCSFNYFPRTDSYSVAVVWK